MSTFDTDVVIIGAGAAGLATAIFAARRAPGLRITLLEGARTPGAKILVSGGSRCNVTNAQVSDADFNGGRPGIIRQVLRAFPAAEAVTFFRDLGVPLHEEPLGKIFPDSNRSRDVLQALLREVDRLGIRLRAAHRVKDVAHIADGHFRIGLADTSIKTKAVVLATGGLALPKTGSDGAGYGFATRLGHSLVPTTPGLVPLLVDAQAPRQFHAAVSGVAVPASLTVRAGDRVAARVSGSLLWTHFGVSGPAALDASRHWLRAAMDGEAPQLVAALIPHESFETLDAQWIEIARRQPRMTVARALATWLPESVAQRLSAALDVPDTQTLAAFSRESRRALVHAALAWPLAVSGSRGYAFAEVTAGGIALAEIDPRTMASRRCPGLYLVGEILDVDGRLGGFNFQWAWSTARVAGEALWRHERDRVS